ncbi:TPA: glutaredoxin-like protein NrdH [Staphylococcus aureus]|uniref:glutaredoxin-like protein NrdH n=1 Tax=Staphylococcus aureus TaxID=1280 RepID=UPI0013A6D8C5|nr:glutaredoxin-like protein NrdH [Staphylococcus aureus]MBH4580061.1 glutaredoxin-like protein NrdH [Staphylococcus aureus]MBH4584945.1 glutaredoxin-like protein NrdH [Staphylococcus aureus]MBH4588034.1 glutaredoxin-like protein NrdH [Staphylococcus aureus]MBH4590601.1 glutaredoxin-like protein NrdH [Staphylococcus aureus]MBH4593273.1 glutaredoxin-like protein NrdH [Staphylococcus aureus]
MSEIIVYTQNDCPPCTFVKNYLTEHQIDFEERNINNQQYRNEMIDFNAFSTPFILLNGNPMYHVDLDEINKVLNIQD